MSKVFSFLYEFKDGQVAWSEHHAVDCLDEESGMKHFKTYHSKDKMIAWRMSTCWGKEADEANILLPITPAREEVLKHFGYIK